MLPFSPGYTARLLSLRNTKKYAPTGPGVRLDQTADGLPAWANGALTVTRSLHLSVNSELLAATHLCHQYECR